MTIKPLSEDDLLELHHDQSGKDFDVVMADRLRELAQRYDEWFDDEVATAYDNGNDEYANALLEAQEKFKELFAPLLGEKK